VTIATVVLILAMIATGTVAIFTVSDALARASAAVESRVIAPQSAPKLPAASASFVDDLQSHIPVGLVLLAPDERIITLNARAETLLMPGHAARPATLEELTEAHDIVASVRQAVHQRRTAAGVIAPQPGHFVEVTAHPLDSGDTLVVLQDVTELRHLRTVRRDFVANVSHELRTPLASIRLLVDTLEAGALEDSDVSSGFVHRIGVEADQLIQMVNELLELSRIESGQLPFRREAVGIAEIVDQAMARLSVVAEDRGIEVTSDLEPELPDAHADRDQAVQVLLNLLFNAIKFTPAGGEVRIQATARDQVVAIAVRDTGVGIHRDDLARIFERFYKSDKSRVRSQGGTGLGLPIARHIVEAHGGNIWAESMEGQGSTFTFTLPVVARADAAG
jgi:two-component system phosphate regulon sensor histidine kinase PhoR